MRILVPLVALVLMLPTLARAQHACESTQTISCPEGQTWDTTTQACTPPPTS
ncbi:MAG: hypothetical protein KDK12_06600 [Rhodobacteraceae bacterium]|nr:hypothetical protein [Paracoccaceae bacterium]